MTGTNATSGTRRTVLTWARRVGLLLVTVAVLEYAAVRLLAPARASWESVGEAAPWLLLTALALELASFACFSGLTRSLLAAPRAVGYGTVLAIDLTGNGVSKVVPGGGATAAAFRFRLLDRVGVPTSQAVGTATLESAVTTLWLVAALGVGLVVAVPLPETAPFLRTALVLAGVLLLAFGGLVAVLAVRPDQVVAVTHAIAARLPLVRPESLEGFVRVLVAQVHVLVQDPGQTRRTALWGLAYWGLDALSLYACLLALGDAPNVPGLLTTYALVNLLALLPLTPSGLGLVETVAVPTLVSFGTPNDVALVGVLLWRLFQFWLPIPIAGLSYGWLRLRRLPAHS